MDEQLKQVIEKAITIAEKTGDFVIEQAPLLLQEFYNWRLLTHIGGICLWLLLMFLVYKSGTLISKKEKIEYYDTNIMGRWFEVDELPFSLWSIIGGLTIVISFICLIIDIYNLIFILVAPKLYLIEYFINKA